ncbi:tail fiber assembly protein [Escherichia coli]|uniref:tail fiber assembly protein n=1 Tax=Escherichia coli TaxID=562 RepID=UPI002024D140|nr:tail fiber assembly protein [Escherichia coli]
MMIVFSRKTNAFYLEENKENYQSEGTWPDDVIKISFEVFSEFSGTPPEGMIRMVGKDGLPEWQPIPPLTKEQLAVLAEEAKQNRIATANDYMNSKQWPGKAAIGRLNGGELEQYNLWLDYLDALDVVDISSAPDINWPATPEV